MSDLISSPLSEDEKNSWGTDPVIYRALDREFRFTLDAAANSQNHKCDSYFTINNNALIQDWSPHKSVWVNPPYGRGMTKQFMNKSSEEIKKGVECIVLLVPAALDAQWLPLDSISEIRIVTGGRLSFYHPTTNKKITGNTKGSMFVIFRSIIRELKITLIDRNTLLSKGA